MPDYRKMIEDDLKIVNNGGLIYAASIVDMITRQIRTKSSKVRRLKERIPKDPSLVLNIIDELAESAVRKRFYSYSLYPSNIKPEEAPNLHLFRVAPRDLNEAFMYLYPVVTGIKYGNYVVNLSGGIRDIIRMFKTYLIYDVINLMNLEWSELKKLSEKINSRLGRWMNLKLSNSEFYVAFKIINYFCIWMKESGAYKGIELPDNVMLLIYNYRRGRGGVHTIPRLGSFIRRWYGDFLADEDRERPRIEGFIDSLITRFKDPVKNKFKVDERTESLINKFLYYFVNGHVNGELLNELMNIKVKAILDDKIKFGFSNVNYFLSNLY